ncbi:MAG TPA: DNA ligase D [Polyangiaceae bacterium]|nr:DNA ligase D [Polyangiaceae bacterium]
MCPGKDTGDEPAQGVGEGSDPLDKYRKKRNPLTTTEPFSTERERSLGATRSGKFVVHLHAARQRHYDLRLQVGRRLMSFAVPRGPSLDPKEKRLAVLTEDHPLEYTDFEDVIPAGNYGAGAMIAWDLGRVVYLENSAEKGLEVGKLDFTLAGYKLGGRFALVRTKRGEGNEWLLLKKPDTHSREVGDILVEQKESVLSGLTVEELPAKAEVAKAVADEARALGAEERALEKLPFEPMLCLDIDVPLDDDERLYELKLDGVRILANKRGPKVTLTYRNGRACTQSYPEVARAVATIPGENVVLDGEIVAFDEQGRPRFQRLGPRIQARSALDVARVTNETSVVYLVFDLVALDGVDLRSLPVIARKKLLARLIRGKGLIRVLDHIEGRGSALFELCKKEALEGVVAKKKNSKYRPGPRRSDDWVKIKCESDDDYVIVGYLPGKGSRGDLGALCVASFHDGALVFRGRVGSGFDHRSLNEVAKTLTAMHVDTPTLAPPLPEEAPKIRWVRPELVASVQHQGYSDDGRLRAPVFRGLRPEIAPESCVAGPHDHASGPLAEIEPSAAASAEVSAAPVTRPELKLSNRSKVFWPEEGFTKGDLLDYYAAISNVMLPFLRERPVVLVRHPDGIHGKSFFQWNVPRGTPEWIRTLGLRDPEDPEHDRKTVFLIDDLDTLLYIINLGCIPVHVLASRASHTDLCDFITFDLDLNEQPFARAIEVALSLREILSDAGLVGFPKTSGQGGLHVLVPLGPSVPFVAAKLLVELLGRLVTARHSTFATMERRVDKRGGRLYVDTGQTGTSRTIVAPYSVRAWAGATVSTPLFWDELSGALDPGRFTLMTVPARVLELGDPFEGLLDARPNIGAALQTIERWVK